MSRVPFRRDFVRAVLHRDDMVIIEISGAPAKNWTARKKM